LCLIARENSKVSSENSSTSFNSANYSLLLQAFHETHKEANKIALYNSRLKGLNNWLEGKVKKLEDEILELKIDFDHLEMIYKASSSLDSSQPINCENCEALQNKVNYLIITTSKLSMGTANLNAILGSQNCLFEKLTLVIKLVFKENKRNTVAFLKQMHSRFHFPWPFCEEL